jgi:hypothetical protein
VLPSSIFRLAGNPSDSASISNSDFELDKRRACLEKGTMIVKRLAEINEDNMEYYLSLKGTDYYKLVDSEINSIYVCAAGAAYHGAQFRAYTA